LYNKYFRLCRTMGSGAFQSIHPYFRCEPIEQQQHRKHLKSKKQKSKIISQTKCRHTKCCRMPYCHMRGSDVENYIHTVRLLLTKILENSPSSMKNVLKFFRYTKSYSVTAMLTELNLYKFDSLVHKCRSDFQRQLHACGNMALYNILCVCIWCDWCLYVFAFYFFYCFLRCCCFMGSRLK